MHFYHNVVPFGCSELIGCLLYLHELFYQLHKFIENLNLSSVSTDAIAFAGKIQNICQSLLNFHANIISPVCTIYPLL